VRALRPEALQQADLSNALGALLRRVEASGTLHAHFSTQGEKIVLSGEVASELLRIAQEGMTNILKHAKAQHVEVKLLFGADTVTLSIADDGVGFDPRGHHDGFGLLGMRERAESIGARLLVSSCPAQGTRVETVIPRSALG
jgi:signal transduction histidine kinase